MYIGAVQRRCEMQIVRFAGFFLYRDKICPECLRNQMSPASSRCSCLTLEPSRRCRSELWASLSDWDGVPPHARSSDLL